LNEKINANLEGKNLLKQQKQQLKKEQEATIFDF
jgi:hypothetical protein